MSEAASALDPTFNFFPTALDPEASTFTATLADLRLHSAAFLQGLETLARIDRGNGARWRELLQQTRQIFSGQDGEESLEVRPQFGILLRQRREQAGLTQQDLAQRTGLSATWLRNIEAGRSRVTRRTLLKLMNIRELLLTAEHLTPTVPSQTGTMSESLNFWVAPHLDAVSLLQELKQRVSGPGGRIEQTYMYLDHQSAFDWWKLANDPAYLTSYRHPMPLEEAAARAVESIGKTPVDLIALGAGDGQLETRFAQAVISHQSDRDLRFYLLDISQPLLSKAHRYAKDCLDAVRGVTVVGMFGNFHYLPLYEQIFYSPAKRRRIFTLLGGTVNNLDDESRFFRDSLRCATRNDLLLLDFSVVFAPSDQPDKIRALDPQMGQPMPEPIVSWLSGPFYRNGNPRQVTGSCQLGLDCVVPGSYSLEAQLRVLDHAGPEREFTVWRVKRYDPDQTIAWLSRLGWEPLFFTRFGQTNRSQPALMLLRKRD